MSTRLRFALALAFLLAGGLALGAEAGAAAGDQSAIGVLATPNPVAEDSSVTVIVTVGFGQAWPQGTVQVSVPSSGTVLGQFALGGSPAPLVTTIPTHEISPVPGVFTIRASASTNLGAAVATTTVTIQPPPADPPSLYVANYGADSISIFGSGANGWPSLGTLAGPATGLSNPEGVVLDSAGDVYVANSSANTITEYPAGASGNAAPVATIGGPAADLDNPRFLAIDSAGNLYAVNALSNSITEYAPDLYGGFVLTATIAGSATGIDDPIGIAVDPNGRIYVSNAGDNSLTGYAPGSNGNVAPIYDLQGDQTGLAGPKGITFNSAGALVVANDAGSVTYYSTGWQGNRPPGEVLTGTPGSLTNAEQPIIDPSNQMLLVDSLTRATLDAWPTDAGGNIAPTDSIQIGAGSQPTQIALNPLNP
jgi:hypothetical protein